MNPPQGIDMSAIHAALAARAGGGPPMPPTQQVTSGPPMPNGMPSSPMQPTPQGPPNPIPDANVSPRPAGPGSNPQMQKAAGQAAQAAGTAQGPQFDDDTKLAAKVLMSKLLKVM